MNAALFDKIQTFCKRCEQLGFAVKQHNDGLQDTVPLAMAAALDCLGRNQKGLLLAAVGSKSHAHLR